MLRICLMKWKPIWIFKPGCSCWLNFADPNPVKVLLLARTLTEACSSPVRWEVSPLTTKMNLFVLHIQQVLSQIDRRITTKLLIVIFQEALSNREAYLWVCGRQQLKGCWWSGEERTSRIIKIKIIIIVQTLFEESHLIFNLEYQDLSSLADFA